MSNSFSSSFRVDMPLLERQVAELERERGREEEKNFSSPLSLYVQKTPWSLFLFWYD